MSTLPHRLISRHRRPCFTANHDSHRPCIGRREGIIFVNSGSAGPRRFKLPISVAEVVVAGLSAASLGDAGIQEQVDCLYHDLPPPTTATSSPRQSCASMAVAA